MTTKTHLSFRDATPEDALFREQMCYEAAFPVHEQEPQEVRPTFEEAMDTPWVREYVEGWGRPGDYGVIACDEAGDPIGAAWYRKYSREAAESAPPYELTLAVTKGHRGQNIGGQLLEQLFDQARAEGVPEICLQVKDDNEAAKRLYDQHGFRVMESEDGYDLMVTQLS